VIFGAGGIYDGDLLGVFLFFVLFYIVFFLGKITFKTIKKVRDFEEHIRKQKKISNKVK
jgi:mannose/fructose/N-acetylgalactosamine-specific phosphotransferase system component IID